MLDTNLKGPWLCCRAAAEPMKRQKWGRVINVTSMLGEVSLPGRSPYASSKGGLTLLTKTLALEWAARRDQRQRPLSRPVRHRDQHAAARTTRPSGRRCRRRSRSAAGGNPVEIGPAAVFLASEASSFMTGPPSSSTAAIRPSDELELRLIRERSHVLCL